jgi:hypothetical protein
MYSISMCIKHNGSVTFEHTGHIADGTCINKGILHDKPNPAIFFADGKDDGNVAKLTGYDLQLDHRQVKNDKGLMKYPQWATETDDGKETIYKTNTVTSLPVAQKIIYRPTKHIEVSFKLVQEISDAEEYISDDEVKYVPPSSNAAGAKAGGTNKADKADKAAAEKAAAEKAAAEKVAAEKAAAEKAAADKAAADNAFRVQEINAQVNDMNEKLKLKLQEADTLKKEIFKLRVSAAELTPDDEVKCKRMPVVVKAMAAEITQNAFSAFRENKKNEDILRTWEMNANKLLIQQEKVYTNRHVMFMMANFYKAWALENPVRAARYEKRAADFNEEHKLQKAQAAVQIKKKQARKMEGSAAGASAGRKRRRHDKDEEGKKGSDDATDDAKKDDEEDDDDEDPDFSFPAGDGDDSE